MYWISLFAETVECYSPETNQWTILKSMSVERSDAHATVLNGLIYICGSSQLCSPPCGALLTVYFRWLQWVACARFSRILRRGNRHLDNSHWDDVATLWTGLHRAQGVYLGSRRLQWGHKTINRYVSVIVSPLIFPIEVNPMVGLHWPGERYDPTTNTWSMIHEMCTPRSNFGIEVIDDMIFVIGGLVQSILPFDSNKYKLRDLKGCVPFGRSANANVLSGNRDHLPKLQILVRAEYRWPILFWLGIGTMGCLQST